MKMFKIIFDNKKANRDLERAYMHTEPTVDALDEFTGVAVRKDVYLWLGTVERLYDQIGDFLRECQYDKQAGYEIDLKNCVIHLSGQRPLTAEEAENYEKGLFDV
jgi:hypothetical protein